MSYQEIKEQSILVICVRYLDTLFRENLARGKNEIFGADLIWRSEKNIKFSADLIWCNWRIFDKFIKKYEQFKNVKQEQYQIF